MTLILRAYAIAIETLKTADAKGNRLSRFDFGYDSGNTVASANGAGQRVAIAALLIGLLLCLLALISLAAQRVSAGDGERARMNAGLAWPIAVLC